MIMAKGNRMYKMNSKQSKHLFHRTRKRQLGLTLIELMITVAIIGILASVAYPSYIDHITRSNRAEALRELTRFANLQEQYFIDHRVYSSTMKDLGIGSGTNYKLPSGNYRVFPTIPNVGTFQLRAKPLGTQYTNDVSCRSIRITNTGRKLPDVCWEK